MMNNLSKEIVLETAYYETEFEMSFFCHPVVCTRNVEKTWNGMSEDLYFVFKLLCQCTFKTQPAGAKKVL